MEPIITLDHVSKEFKVLNRREGLKGSVMDLFSRDYKIVKAVNDVSMDIMPGEICGYLGPNGAGKSTTIKMMTGVLKPTSGEILVNGKVPYKNRTENAQNIGVVFGQRSQLWWSLPLIESFKLLRDIYQIEDKQYKDMMELYESLVDIKSLYNKPVRQMSLGQRTLSDILAAFLHNPGVVFLDEPTIGLDVSMKSKIRELIKALNQEKKTTVILTTHDMGDVDALCKRIVIIDKGVMLYDNSIENLKSFFGAYRTMRLRFTKDAEHLTEEALKEQANLLASELKEKYPDVPSLSVSVDGDWIDVLLNEDEIPLMQVMNHIQQSRRIYDVRLKEISTESVIKKIYDKELE
ncbi:MAG: ATP-binding cassette domain-containing protein [Lachnospiraceae bacterium]|nr:ATP-binding cassette domain-containing protein [Lachnospiraceae bacterium]